MSSDTLLRANRLAKRYGGVRALDGAALEMRPGEIVGLIGPNGSGKTTLINAISGAIRVDIGDIVVDGTEIGNWPARKRVHFGINRTFQIPAPFKKLSVEENVIVAATFGRRGGTVEEAIHLAGLGGLEDREADSLNSAQQKRLDLARALATRPKLLLVDEMAAGLNPDEAQQLVALLKQLSSMGITLLVVEHIMPFLRRLVERIFVMEQGKVIYEGSLEGAAHDPKIVEAFLGSSAVKVTAK